MDSCDPKLVGSSGDRTPNSSATGASMYGLFAWFCKNRGVITAERRDGEKFITARIGKTQVTRLVNVNDVNETSFGKVVHSILKELYASLS